jgi:hypothetical protein
MLLEVAPDDFEDADEVRKLLRGLREARMAKLRQSVEVLDAGGGFKMNGVGGMELGEARSFITGVVDGLRKIGKSREEARREIERMDTHRARTMKMTRWTCGSAWAGCAPALLSKTAVIERPRKTRSWSAYGKVGILGCVQPESPGSARNTNGHCPYQEHA